MSASGLVGIDHALIGVRDLEAARRQWQRLGFTVTPRGRHIGWGTGNYCLMLASGYIELLGIVEPKEFLNRLDLFLEKREGLMGLAFASEDEVATAQALKAAGIAAEGPKILRRRLELPEGAVEPEFGLVMLPESATPDLSAFICRHRTPHLIRRPDWQIHANGALRLEGVIAVAEHWPDLVPAYRLLFGAQAIAAGEDEVTISTGMGRLVFLDRAGLARLYPRLAQRTNAFPAAGPFLAALEIGIGRMAIARDHLQRYRIAHEAMGKRLVVPPEEASGLILDFADV